MAVDFKIHIGRLHQPLGYGLDDGRRLRLHAIAVGVEEDSVGDELARGGDGLAEVGRGFGEADATEGYRCIAGPEIHIQRGDFAHLDLIEIEDAIAIDIEADAAVLNPHGQLDRLSPIRGEGLCAQPLLVIPQTDAVLNHLFVFRGSVQANPYLE